MENEKNRITVTGNDPELNNTQPESLDSHSEEAAVHPITVSEIDEIIRATDAASNAYSDGDSVAREISDESEIGTDSVADRESASAPEEADALSNSPLKNADDVSADGEMTSSDEQSEADPDPYEPHPERIIYGNVFPDDAFSPYANGVEPVVTDLLGDPVEADESLEEADAEDEDSSVEEEFAEASDDEPEEIPVKAQTVIRRTVAPPPKEESYDPDKPRRVDALFDFVELLVFTLVAVLCITSFVVKHAVVEGNSMYDTLENGDVLIISDLFYTPRSGDIIVVEDYTTMLKKPIVKRVIAVGGQTVRVTKHGIYINNSKIMLDEPYVYTDYDDYEYIIASNEELNKLPGFTITKDYYEFLVPDGELFVMGDHRNDSTDSRIIGTVLEEAVLGKVLFRVYPFEKFGEIPNS